MLRKYIVALLRITTMLLATSNLGIIVNEDTTPKTIDIGIGFNNPSTATSKSILLGKLGLPLNPLLNDNVVAVIIDNVRHTMKNKTIV
jgi:hypothetical protein